MKTKLNAYGAFAMLLLVGCGSGQPANGDLTADQDVDSAKEDSARRRKHPELYKCDTDADCVAVEQASCCPNGFLVALNTTMVDKYNETYACNEPPHVCPHFIVQDNRVSQCDGEKHTCQMIDPTQIRCGGFIAPERQHHCPTGWTCQLNTIPDVPGSCVKTEE